MLGDTKFNKMDTQFHDGTKGNSRDAERGRVHDTSIGAGSSPFKNTLSEDEQGFNLFTHQLVRKMHGNSALKLTYDDLRLACLELYLSVKIRSDDEIDNYNKDMFLLEKEQHADTDGYALIDMIKSSVEALMNMKMDDTQVDEAHHQSKDRYNDVNHVDGLDSIDVDLPEGAKQGLKDASQDLKLNTAQMNEQLKKSLPLAVGAKFNKK